MALFRVGPNSIGSLCGRKQCVRSTVVAITAHRMRCGRNLKYFLLAVLLCEQTFISQRRFWMRVRVEEKGMLRSTYYVCSCTSGDDCSSAESALSQRKGYTCINRRTAEDLRYCLCIDCFACPCLQRYKPEKKQT